MLRFYIFCRRLRSISMNIYDFCTKHGTKHKILRLKDDNMFTFWGK